MVVFSSGLLMYRRNNGLLEFLLAHPGGPLFANKDEGYWGIPKGMVDKGESLFDAALREFKEETGLDPSGPYLSLGSVVFSSGKIVHAWAFEGEWKGHEFNSKDCSLEWPPRSGKMIHFPEIDKIAFFDIDDALKKIGNEQREFIIRLQDELK